MWKRQKDLFLKDKGRLRQVIKLTGLNKEEVAAIGMKLDRVRNCGEKFHMCDLIRE